MPFEGFDFSGFWVESAFARTFDRGALTPAALAETEKALGYKLPASYVWLMERRNGGVPVNTRFPTGAPTGWADDHIAIETIFGAGPGTRNSIAGETRLMIEKWGCPPIGAAIRDCPTGGHQEVFLDYRERGPQGEPRVVCVDQEDGFSILPLAENFEDFIREPQPRREFETEEDE